VSVSLRRFGDTAGEEVQMAMLPDRYFLEFHCRVPNTPNRNIGFTLFNDADVPVASSCLCDSNDDPPQGEIYLYKELPIDALPAGEYRVEGAVWDSQQVHEQEDFLLSFTVVNEKSKLDVTGQKPRGGVLIQTPWEVTEDRK
jgi:hypothetical protein